ncbi:hypothetical protein [Paenibacillus albiflavus]|nr:hypothetical protein [Paenibacillus albiflavus]
MQNNGQSTTKAKVIIGFSIVFFGFCGYVAIDSENYFMLVLSLLFVAAGIYGLFKFRKTKTADHLKGYQPGKGFWFFRKTPQQKVKMLSLTQWFCILMSLGFFYYLQSFRVFIGLIVGLGLSQIVKQRIKFHTPIDDESLFELEARGVILKNETVQSLYKDFDTWEQTRAGNQIHYLTPDSLVRILFEDENYFSRYEYRLRNINKVDIIGNPGSKQGYILAIGTMYQEFIRINLNGKTYQDSPEQFLFQFFTLLDCALLNIPAPMPSNQNQPTQGEGRMLDL